MRRPEQDILDEITNFFSVVFDVKVNNRGYKYAHYKKGWLKKLALTENSQEEAKANRTTKKLQEKLVEEFGARRIKPEAKVAEGMTLRFDSLEKGKNFKLDASKSMAFDILDMETGSAFEISMSDAFAEFFKDVLKGLLDSRIKRLYICMRNHNYNTSKGGIGKSGYIKVRDSEMIQQYINLARLYKLEIVLVDLCPECNK
jgi:hypothetical protein